MTCTLHAAHLYFVDFKANEKINKEIFVYTHKIKNPKSWLIIKLVMYTVQHLLQLLLNSVSGGQVHSSSFIMHW